MRSLFRLAAMGPAILLGALLAATPATAGTSAPGDEPNYYTMPGELGPWPEPPVYGTGARTVALTVNDGYSAGNNYGRHVYLVCSPVRGTSHPYAWSACNQLERAEGNIEDIRAITPWFGCTRQYRPVTVTANGWWDGRYIRYQRTFDNSCSMRARTGSIFRF
ncbi:SSI family serine proteinase inhibitor [Spongiactinospora sp. TRM90649]|uniref:SSI family serine proteinase inhibitor n=1 Tax=Spongiactinospora sp. TRM90649 TaxID=3031114 RepID=UPI0023F948FF|nr:SSI family serine proteinase inhibitor [Spongiactinospora sp. TRM90649]MDF5756474.1 SSI family serine proteinase inhibitor [Spongiactinospora sp. TRM90649]